MTILWDLFPNIYNSLENATGVQKISELSVYNFY